MNLVSGEHEGRYEPDPTLKDHGGYEDKYDIVSEDHGDRDKPDITPKDCGGGVELDLPLRNCEDGDKHDKDFKGGAELDLLPKTQKILKNSRKKKKGPTGSITLYQAYLNLIPSVKKKTNADLITEKKIQPPSVAKSKTVCEHGETFIPKCSASQPVVPQKKLNEEQTTRKLPRKQFYQKNATLRRDMLAESSEIFLPILESAGLGIYKNDSDSGNSSDEKITNDPDSDQESKDGTQTEKFIEHELIEQEERENRQLLKEDREISEEREGCSKELLKCFDSQEKLDRSGPSSFNEMSKSKKISLHLNPSCYEPLEFSLKRSAKHVLPSDFRIAKKRKIDSYPFKNIQSRIDFQVVIMKDFQGSPMRKVDLDEVQHLLIAEVMRFILENEKPHFIPQFFGIGVDQNHKWFILNCKDQDTMKWVLNLKPSNASRSFTIVKSEKAPWRSVRICLTIRKDKPEVKRVVSLLASQNRMLNVAGWNHVKITGYRGEWTLYFLLTVDESKKLDDHGWMVFFELGMLQVLKL